MARVFFKTFGCRSNLYDTQVMISNLKNYSLTQNEQDAEIIIINSCTVTNKADREIRAYARKYSSEGKRVIFTGCGVKHWGESLYAKGFVDSVFAHSHKEDIEQILATPNRVFLPKEKVHKHVDSTLLPEIVGKVRAFIKIQEGCNFACSYCVIPSVRGNARSFSEKHILEQIRILAQNNVSEVILTGTNIGSYGLDTKTHIAVLVQKIHDIQGIKRIRLGSLEPSQIDKRFLEILELEKIEKHLHIALQHTSPTMLQIMNRKNTFESDKELFEEIAQKGFSLGTDYIVGHHGETQEIFEEALQNLKTLPLTHIHPFIYSPRTGTKSAMNKEKLQVIQGNIAKERLKIIQSLVQEKNREFRKQNQTNALHVLVESIKSLDTTQYYAGLDQYFNKVYIPIQQTLMQESPHIIPNHSSQDSQNLKGKWLIIDKYEIETHNIATKYRIKQ